MIRVGVDELDLTDDLRTLDQLLGDTRSRFHRRLTPFASSEPLIELDRKIREARGRPRSPELQAELRRLAARLRALDPH